MLFVYAINLCKLFLSKLLLNNFLGKLYLSKLFLCKFFLGKPFLSNLFLSNLFLSNLFLGNLFLSNLFLSNLFLSNLFLSNLFLSNLLIHICFQVKLLFFSSKLSLPEFLNNLSFADSLLSPYSNKFTFPMRINIRYVPCPTAATNKCINLFDPNVV